MRHHLYLLVPGKIFYSLLHGTTMTEYKVDLLCPSYKIPGKTLQIINKIQYNSKISCFHKVVSKKFWAKYHILDQTEFSTEEDNIIVLVIGVKADREINKWVFEKRKQNRAGLVLLLFDSIRTMPKYDREIVINSLNYFDLVMTFDKEDANNYEIQHFDLPYDKVQTRPDDKDHVTNDLLFVGNDKGRGTTIESIAKTAVDQNVIIDFTIVNTVRLFDRTGAVAQVKYHNRPIEYADIVEGIKKSNCILEVLCDGQTTASLRYYEAVAYNKKLLTNNKNVTKLPYYDSRYIKVFDDIKNIDFNWVKKREDVDYNYQGEFSTELLLKRIVEGVSVGSK